MIRGTTWGTSLAFEALRRLGPGRISWAEASPIDHRLVLCPAPAWALCLGLERSRTQGIFERARRTASELFDIAGRHIEAADGPHLLNAEDGVHHGWR